jgi:hypothetical protein
MVCASIVHMNTKMHFIVQERLNTACGNPAIVVVSQQAVLLKTLRFSSENDLGMLRLTPLVSSASQTTPVKA